MKKKELMRALILIIAIVVVVLIIKLIQGFDTTKKDLKKLGYNKDEIEIIINTLDKETINKVKTLEYNEYLDDIITEKYYIPNNLDRYLQYSKNEKDITKIISLVNVNADNKFYTNTTMTDTSKEYSMLVNKYYYLDANYEAADIVNISDWYAYKGHKANKEVYEQYKKMWKDANKEGLIFLVNSSFRTLEEQQKEYNSFGDEYAARPGFSEHQTGFALDIVKDGTNGNDFEDTDEFKWLEKNSYKYGFILRYPKDKENITGYEYESWHYRYLGVELATKVYESKLTYDEYYAYYCEYKNEC